MGPKVPGPRVLGLTVPGPKVPGHRVPGPTSVNPALQQACYRFASKL